MSEHAICALCGEHEQFTVYCQAHTYQVLKCNACDFIFIPQSYRKAVNYTDYKSEAVTAAVKAGNNWLKIQRHKLRIKQIKRYKPGGTLFDLGSGWGHFLKTAQTSGYTVSGVELSEEPYVYSVKYLNLPVQRADFFQLNFLNQFDVITLWDVLEHIDRPVPFVVKCNQALKPNGLLVIQVPQIDSFIARKKKCNWNMMGLDHVNYFSRKTLSNLLSANGFEVLEMRSSWEVKLFIMYTLLPLIKRFKVHSKQKPSIREVDQNISAAERQHFFNRITRFPKPVLWLLIQIHNLVYGLLSRLNIGEELVIIAQKRTSV